MTGHQPQMCACGHPVGDHQPGGPARHGICLVPGCGCREFNKPKGEREHGR